MKELNLQGEWAYAFDKEDKGVANEWFKTRFSSAPFKLPGTTSTNKVGAERVFSVNETSLTKEQVETHHDKFHYYGVFWLQKTFVLPKDWGYEETFLEFERILGRSDVWLNDVYLGHQDSLSTKHHYDVNVDDMVIGGANTITLRIDNTNRHKLGDLASGYSKHTQTIWSGVVGQIRLWQANLLKEDVQIAYKKEASLLNVHVRLPNNLNQQIEVYMKDNKTNRLFKWSERTFGEDGTFIYSFDVDNFLTWSEYTPYTYNVHVSCGSDEVVKPIGILNLEADEHTFYLNSHRLFLRGTLDCAIFPETGYPPTDEASWEKIFATIQSFGLNHIRFHSWCPPEAAFSSADRLGVYLMVEGPFWLDRWFNNKVGDYKEHYTFIKEEVTSILMRYGHHPSFCFFSTGNELAGDFDYLAKLISSLPFHENQILTTITANTTNKKRKFFSCADDFFVGVEYKRKGLRGNRFLDEMVESTQLDYQEAADIVPLPVVTHEIGQYASYPDINVIEKYNGALIPTNLITIKEDLKRKGLLDTYPAFRSASVHLAADLYKAETEAVVRSNGVSGYQLLGLQDYPGQNTASVGLLDVFWETKGLVKPRWYKGFCNDVVPIVELEKRIFSEDEQLSLRIGVRYDRFIEARYPEGTLQIYHNGDRLTSFDFKADVKQGQYQVVAKKIINVASLIPWKKYMEELKIVVSLTIDQQTYQNEWEIWYCKQFNQKSIEAPEIIEDHWLSPKLINSLENGETCLLTPNPNALNDPLPGNFFPVFWSPVFFETKDSCGTVVDNSHPLFNTFSSKDYASFQWKNLLEHALSFKIEKIKGLVNPVPNFFNNEKRTYIFEAKVGNGRLICCGFDLDRLHFPEQVAFKYALYHYMMSDLFQPKSMLSIKELRQLFKEGDKVKTETGYSPEDLAYRKTAWSDLSKSKRMGPDKGNDGNPLTFWAAPSQTEGHWWCVDLGESCSFEKIIIEPLNSKTNQFTIELSQDGEEWTQFLQSEAFKSVHVFEKSGIARYVKVKYFHPINSDAGQYSCRVLQKSNE